MKSFFKSIAFALALSLATVASPVIAQDDPKLIWDYDDGWEVWAFSTHCAAYREYENGDALSINYTPVENHGWISLRVKNATSLKDGETTTLYVYFRSGRSIDDGWGSKTFTVSRKDGNAAPFLASSFEGAVLLKDVAISDAILFSRDGYYEFPIGSYSLDGSARAVASLRNCAFAVSGLNPNDPFLK